MVALVNQSLLALAVGGVAASHVVFGLHTLAVVVLADVAVVVVHPPALGAAVV